MWRELIFFNKQIEQGIRRALASGLVLINPDTGLVELSPNAYSMAYDSNWLFFGHNTASRDCFTWHSIMFNCHNKFVHEFCKLRCYKVVVKARNFIDAIGFRNAILASPYLIGSLTPLQGKIGKDERDYTDRFFNGFIYCDGFDDAQEKYAIVRKLVDENVTDGKNINIIIKRTCTEFEREHGPTDSAFWQSMTKDELHTQHLLEDVYRGLKNSSVQPDWLQNKIIASLAKWANSVGDKSWMEYFGCEDILTMKAVTYHLIEKEVKQKTSGGKKRITKKAKTLITKGEK